MAGINVGTGPWIVRSRNLFLARDEAGWYLTTVRLWAHGFHTKPKATAQVLLCLKEWPEPIGAATVVRR